MNISGLNCEFFILVNNSSAILNIKPVRESANYAPIWQL